ncbi:CHAP domain-containing protein [Microbacteriaceae bacterium VKM Ac-2854]|nr:CHAP domain-containing protein [Microbacteriaceae bacterium VKM Ac-2854]
MQKVDAVADVNGSDEQDREVVVFDSRRSRREAEITLASRTAATPVVAAQTAPRAASAPVPPSPVASATAAPKPAASAVRRRPRVLRSIVSAAAVSVVAGLVAVASLPAYSFNPEADSQAAADAASALRSVGAQDLTVASTAAIDAAIRDSFSAPTQAELDAAAAQAAALAAAAAAAAAAEAAAAEAASSPAATASGTGSYASVSPRQPGDDYPWRTELTDDQGGGLSPLRYYYRECVDFVAWRLNRDAGSTSAPFKWTWGNLTPGGGSAYAWAGQWASHGWVTSNTPIAGSVAWFNGNHVAYVQAVNADGSVALEEYNWGNDHEYHTRTISASEVPLFLYPPS